MEARNGLKKRGEKVQQRVRLSLFPLDPALGFGPAAVGPLEGLKGFLVERVFKLCIQGERKSGQGRLRTRIVRNAVVFGTQTVRSGEAQRWIRLELGRWAHKEGIRGSPSSWNGGSNNEP